MKIACVQSNVFFNDPGANAARAVQLLGELRKDGVELVVFPEAFLTGYCAASLDEARAIAIPRDHPAIRQISEACRAQDVMAVVGFAESEGDALYNSAVLIEPSQPDRFYRKTHLPFLGYDRFATPGQELSVFETRLGNLGLLICYDMRPPEAARVLALAGADILILPTNWPEGAEISAEYVAVARAAENKMFVATCDRVGTEKGASFIGLSKIIAPNGKIIAAAGADETVLIADLDLAEARQKRTVNIPGEYELDIFGSRNPSLYRTISNA